MNFYLKIIIVLSIIGIALGINYNLPTISAESSKFIGDNSILYIQNGCPHCDKQLKLFGDNKTYLHIIDCWENLEECKNISGVPSWLINDKLYSGVKSEDELREIIYDSSIGKSEPYFPDLINNEVQAELTGKNMGDKR